MGKAVIPSMSVPTDLIGVAARVDGLLELWTQDFRDMPVAALVALHDAGKAAVLAGEAGRLAEVIRTAATDDDIVDALEGLMGSFHATKEDDKSILGSFLSKDVQAAHPTRLALEAACAHLRRTKDFAPSIKAVLETLEEKQAAFETRAKLLDRLASRVALAASVLEGRAGG
jgi:hypothetical protein